jgi:ribosomal protein S18 acetylase RimI-like enzyme
MAPAPRPPAMVPTPRSLVLATDIDVLAIDHTVTRRDGYLVVRSPSNPTFWFGNFLVFDDAPRPGDGGRWERLFEREFADEPRVRHRTLRWDRSDGEADAATEEFTGRGYDLESLIGLVAEPGELVAHPRANQDVRIRRLDPATGGPDEPLWASVVEIQVAGRDPRMSEDDYRDFSRARYAELRALFNAGRGAWYVALTPAGEVAASCGIVATGDRGRFQAVETAQPHRRRGICSRLVVDAAAHAAAEHLLRTLVIVADADYHALGLYESLGFRRRERVSSLCRRPADQ